MKQINGGITAVPGIRASGVHGGLKPDNLKDVALIVADSLAVGAGVFTQNRVCAAPVVLSREHLADHTAQAIVVNSGNANACTGEQGLDNARKMAALVGERLNVEATKRTCFFNGRDWRTVADGCHQTRHPTCGGNVARERWTRFGASNHDH